jgi:uncharacterized membrane protein YhaH (DUF805 family)
VSFQEAVTAALTKYVDLSGRARRSEYWYFVLFNVIVTVLALVLDRVIGFPIFQLVVGLGLLLPGLGVAVRRLHDTGRSGWWLLLGLIPLVGSIILIVWMASDSQPDNQYGPSPKFGTAPHYA